MGTHRFRLSNIMPNSWFFKLRNDGNRENKGSRGNRGKTIKTSMNKGQENRASSMESNPTQRSIPPPSPLSKQPYLKNRASSYVPSRDRSEDHLLSPAHPKASDTLFPSDPKRKSMRKPRPKKPSITSPILIPSPVSPVSSSLNDLRSVFNVIIEHKLHPISTKPENNNAKKHGSSPRKSNGARRSRVRLQSPRSGKNRFRPTSPPAERRRKGFPESFVVVKPSSFPQRDFRESMAEMIIENDLQSPEDLEELLACYLSLNSSEYHDMIVEVFQQIWIDLSGIFMY